MRETGRGKREIKNAGVKDREEEKEREREGGEWTKSCSKSASANCKKDTEEKGREERGAHLHPGGSYFPFFREGY